MGSVYFLTVLVLRAKIFQVESTKETFRRERERVDESFAEIYVDAVSKAEEVGVEPKLPRVASRQFYKSNNPAQSPFLDHIINNLDAKFEGAQIYICSLIAFISVLACSFIKNGGFTFVPHSNCIAFRRSRNF